MQHMELFCQLSFVSVWQEVKYDLNFYRENTQHIAVYGLAGRYAIADNTAYQY